MHIAPTALIRLRWHCNRLPLHTHHCTPLPFLNTRKQNPSTDHGKLPRSPRNGTERRLPFAPTDAFERLLESNGPAGSLRIFILFEKIFVLYKAFVGEEKSEFRQDLVQFHVGIDLNDRDYKARFTFRST